MNRKICKSAVDILMLLAMILEYDKKFLPEIIHEVLGITLIVLFIIHIILNLSYIKTIFKGKYNFKRIIMLFVNILFLITFFGSIISGIIVSEILFANMFNKDFNAIRIHNIFSYACIISLGMHLGINWVGLYNKISNKINNKKIIILLVLLIFLCSSYAIYKLNYFNLLLDNVASWSLNGSLIGNLFGYSSIIIMISIVTNLIYKRVK